MIHGHHGQELAPDLHQGRHVVDAHQHLSVFLADLLTEVASAGAVRQNVPAKELARFCLDALGAAGALPSKGAVQRLLTVVQAGLAVPAVVT